MLHYLETNTPYGILPRPEGDKVIDKFICKTKSRKYIIIHLVYSMCRPARDGNMVKDETANCITFLDKTDWSLEGYERCYMKSKRVIAYFYKNMHMKSKLMFCTVQRESVECWQWF